MEKNTSYDLEQALVVESITMEWNWGLPYPTNLAVFPTWNKPYWAIPK
jgi:hypothetical protein